MINPNAFYTLGKNGNGEDYIHCKTCSKKSFHYMDIKKKFCAHCGKFHIENGRIKTRYEE